MISYYTALNFHGYMILGPRYGICPYQPAGGLSKPIEEKKTFKINEKSAKKMSKKVTIFNRAWTQ